MRQAAVTAEWICTQCGATNRKLVAIGASQVADRCVSCHTPHFLAPDDRPVRWNARRQER